MLAVVDIRVMYEGGAEAVVDLAKMITEEGFVVEYEPPIEYRDGLEHEAVHVLLLVLEKLGEGGLTYAGGLIVKKVAKRFEAKHPGTKAEVQIDDDGFD